VLLLLGLLAYATPWLINPGVNLSSNAYDLAEWASLPPAERAVNPPLVTSLCLRLPLVCLALIAVLQETATKKRWFRLSVVAGFTIAGLPPLEFFTQTSSDPNFRQQFALSLVTLIGGLVVSASTIRKLFQTPIILVLAFAGTTACMIGLAQGYRLMRQFGSQMQAGLGGVVMAFVFLAFAVTELQRRRTRTA
jgi:hypothetical protein